MTPDALIEDLEHRRDLAGELARYADGSQGLGLGTALAGVMAMLNPLFMAFGSHQVAAYAQQHARQAGFWEMVAPLLLLCIGAFSLLNAFTWLLLKNAVQAHFYHRHGQAGSAPPVWEARLGWVLFALLAFAGLWISGGVLSALKGSQEPGRPTWYVLGIPMLKLSALVAFVGTTALIATAWRRVRGWRNWLGWSALCAPFLFFVSAPLFNDLRPGITGIITVVLLLSFFAGFLYLPFMALYVGIRDHLGYRRLLKELDALTSLEERP